MRRAHAAVFFDRMSCPLRPPMLNVAMMIRWAAFAVAINATVAVRQQGVLNAKPGKSAAVVSFEGESASAGSENAALPLDAEAAEEELLQPPAQEDTKLQAVRILMVEHTASLAESYAMTARIATRRQGNVPASYLLSAGIIGFLTSACFVCCLSGIFVSSVQVRGRRASDRPADLHGRPSKQRADSGTASKQPESIGSSSRQLSVHFSRSSIPGIEEDPFLQGAPLQLLPAAAQAALLAQEQAADDTDDFYDEDMFGGLLPAGFNSGRQKQGAAEEDFGTVKSVRMTPESSLDMGGKVSFAPERDVVKVKSVKVNHEQKGPAHGHYVPQEIMCSRNSFQDATAVPIGGRTKTIAGLQCILVEPQGLVINPEEYVSAGLVIALDGAELTQRAIEEWGRVLKEGQFLDAAMSFILPDLQEEDAPEPELLQRLVREALKVTKSTNCVLVGKGWGAHRVAELGSSKAMAGIIAGVVLAAPGGEVPLAVQPDASGGEERSGMRVPCMVLWSATDRITPYGGRSSTEWADALAATGVPLIWKMLRAGGHDLDNMLRQDMSAVGLDVLCFTKAVMLLNWLHANEDAEAPQILHTMSQFSLGGFGPPKAQRLLEELPSYISAQLGSNDKDEEVTDTVERLLQNEGPERAREKVLAVLEGWIRNNMQEIGL